MCPQTFFAPNFLSATVVGIRESGDPSAAKNHQWHLLNCDLTVLTYSKCRVKRRQTRLIPRSLREMSIRRSKIIVKSSKIDCFTVSTANSSAPLLFNRSWSKKSVTVDRNYREEFVKLPLQLIAHGDGERRCLSLRFLSWNADQVTGAQLVTSHYAEFPCHSHLNEILSRRISQLINSKMTSTFWLQLFQNSPSA